MPPGELKAQGKQDCVEGVGSEIRNAFPIKPYFSKSAVHLRYE